MRFFVREPNSAALTAHAEKVLVPRYYAEHLPGILPHLPEALAWLVRRSAATHSPLNLHDALVREITVDMQGRTVTLALRTGDKQVGYSNVDLQYSDVVATALNLPLLRRIAEDSTVELLYDELDVTQGGRLRHVLLFWPHDELEIMFGGFQVSQEPQAERRANLPTHRFRLIGGGAT